MSRAEGLVSYHTTALVHALLTPAFVGALEKVLREPAYHRAPGGEEGSHDISELKDSCPFPLVYSAWDLSLSPAYFLVWHLQYVFSLEAAVGSELLCSSASEFGS